ncbi:TPA: hypothetical protein ACIX8N_004217 [Escherichia coli]
MIKILFGIVLYSYTPKNSPTYSHLINNNINPDDIYLHDNREENIKLSTVYNDFLNFANENSYDYLVILDDDTFLSDEYLKSLHSNLNCSVLIPNLTYEHKIISPLKFKGILRFCMSGIRLHLSKLNSLKFSENYSLYGIDDYLVIFLIKNKIKVKISGAYIEHELSTIRGIQGTNSYSDFKCIELLRAHILNFKEAPLFLKIFYFKKISFFLFLLFKRRNFLESMKIFFSPAQRSMYIQEKD